MRTSIPLSQARTRLTFPGAIIRRQKERPVTTTYAASRTTVRLYGCLRCGSLIRGNSKPEGHHVFTLLISSVARGRSARSRRSGVRVLLGLMDREATKWDGSAAVDR